MSLFARAAEGLPLEHEFIPVRTPNKNAYVESFNSLLEINVVAAEYFYSFAHAYKRTVEIINFYKERIHGTLKTTPSEYNKKYYDSL